MSCRVMIVDPASQHFLQTGDVKEGGMAWKTIDLGYPQGIQIEAYAVMEAESALRGLRRLVRQHGIPL